MSKNFVGVQFIEVVRQGKYTIAFGTYSDAKIGRIDFAGVSARNPDDKKENSTRGRNFAIARAFKNCGKQIDKNEWKTIEAPKGKKVVKAVSQPKVEADTEISPRTGKPKRKYTKKDKPVEVQEG